MGEGDPEDSTASSGVNLLDLGDYLAPGNYLTPGDYLTPRDYLTPGDAESTTGSHYP